MIFIHRYSSNFIKKEINQFKLLCLKQKTKNVNLPIQT